MMSSQQDAAGTEAFPPNPFRANEDAASPAPPAPPPPSQPYTDAPPPQQQQQQQQHYSYSDNPQPAPPPAPATSAPLRSQTAPTTESGLKSFDLDPHGTSFEPIDAGFVGSGQMDSGAGGGGVGVAARGGGAYQTNSAQQPMSPPGQSKTLWQSLTSCFTIEAYRPYFDVDTVDVKNRIIGSVQLCMVPDGFRNNLLGVNRNDGKGPDLYGPFWITMTLVFFVSVTSNMSIYLHSKSRADYEYDIRHLIRAMSVLFSFVFLVPTILCLVFRCLAIQVSLVELITLYGYGLVPYVPVTLLCLIPIEWIVWLSLAIATAISAMLVLRNVAGTVLAADVTQQKAGPLLGCIMGLHIVFFLVLKLAFYQHHKK